MAMSGAVKPVSYNINEAILKTSHSGDVQFVEFVTEGLMYLILAVPMAKKNSAQVCRWPGCS